MSNPPLGSNESKRLHLDWWGKCRTCRFWDGADKISPREGREPMVQIRWEPAPCTNPASPLYGQETRTEGHCKKWDSFDVDVALLEGDDALDEDSL